MGHLWFQTIALHRILCAYEIGIIGSIILRLELWSYIICILRGGVLLIYTEHLKFGRNQCILTRIHRHGGASVEEYING